MDYRDSCSQTKLGTFIIDSVEPMCSGHAIYITESVDSVCRDTTYTQYMLTSNKKTLKM